MLTAEAERHGNEDSSNDKETDGEEISPRIMNFASVNQGLVAFFFFIYIKICLSNKTRKM